MKLPRPHVLTFLLLLPLSAHGEVAVLLHGVLGSSNSWEQSGAVDALVEMGWERAGRIEPGTDGTPLLAPALYPPRGKRQLYLADIPSLIPLEQQSRLLQQLLIALMQRHPDERLYLIGHSAGGVVSRMVAVNDEIEPLSGLITIASPHLGSPYANLAYDLATLPFPLRMVPKLLAHDKYQLLRRSRHMIKGLVLARPGTHLYWLNRQPHPNIHYVSIVRRQPPAHSREALVPYWSQDLNRVSSLQGHATSISTFAPHRITQQDGYLLGVLLNQMVTR